MSKPKAPPQPDYVGAANAQGQANIDAARVSAKLSNPNVITPFGTQTVSFNGDTPTVNQSLTPEAQKLYSQQLGIQGGLSEAAQSGIGNVRRILGSPFDASSLPQAPINAGTTAQNAIMQRLQPQIDRNRNMRETELANQGIMRGSEAYQNAQSDLGNQENDLYSQAALQGINLDTNARQNALQEQLSLRELPLNELNSLMGSSQVNIPQFQGFQGQNIGAAPLANAASAQGQADMNAYNAKVGQQNSLMQGLFGLGTAGIMFSDRRLKKNIQKIGAHNNLNVYSYEYVWGESAIGYMADEVMTLHPNAVFVVNGYHAVDYRRL